MILTEDCSVGAPEEVDGFIVDMEVFPQIQRKLPEPYFLD